MVVLNAGQSEGCFSLWLTAVPVQESFDPRGGSISSGAWLLVELAVVFESRLLTGNCSQTGAL